MAEDSGTTTIITSANVDLTNCAREQIHIPNSIQSYGCMVILDEENFKIIQASHNLDKFFPSQHIEVIGLSIEELLNNDVIDIIKRCLQQDIFAINPIRIDIEGKTLNLIIHQNQGFIFLEFEPIDDKYNNNFISFYNITRKVLDEMQEQKTFEGLSEVIVKNIRQITGFDRVMVYRFDSDGSGHIIAEDRREELESFRDLRYPATDVPKPARILI